MEVMITALLLGGVLAGEGTRPFHLGFTRWPADLTIEGVQTASEFALAHGDIVSVMFIGGIPWPEALTRSPYSADVNNNLANRPEGKKLFPSISPLNRDRSGLAPYWGEKDNLPLPKDWESKSLNDPQVKQAFLNFSLDAVAKMHPDYLAVGIELNVLLSKNADKWKEVKELYRSTYAGVKAKYPTLPVCFTTEVMHYRMLAGEAAGNQEARAALRSAQRPG
jgi:hypothetical protein